MVKYFEGVGRRKSAIARVRLNSGEGKVLINDKEEASPSKIYLAPLKITGNLGKFNFSVKVKGGGKTSQKEAIRLAIARALLKFDQNLKPVLRKGGFVTTDARVKERKKPGLKSARRAPQWQKR